MWADPKTFEEYLKRAPWGPWIVVAALTVLMGIILLIVVVFERDPMEQFGRIAPKDKLIWAIVAGAIVVVSAVIAPFWSRNIRILAQRGRRAEGWVDKHGMLSRHGVHVTTIAYVVDGAEHRIKRDIPSGELDRFVESGVTVLYDPEKPTRAMIIRPEIAALPLR